MRFMLHTCRITSRTWSLGTYSPCDRKTYGENNPGLSCRLAQYIVTPRGCNLSKMHSNVRWHPCAVFNGCLSSVPLIFARPGPKLGILQEPSTRKRVFMNQKGLVYATIILVPGSSDCIDQMHVLRKSQVALTEKHRWASETNPRVRRLRPLLYWNPRIQPALICKIAAAGQTPFKLSSYQSSHSRRVWRLSSVRERPEDDERLSDDLPAELVGLETEACTVFQAHSSSIQTIIKKVRRVGLLPGSRRWYGYLISLKICYVCCDPIVAYMSQMITIETISTIRLKSWGMQSWWRNSLSLSIFSIPPSHPGVDPWKSSVWKQAHIREAFTLFMAFCFLAIGSFVHLMIQWQQVFFQKIILTFYTSPWSYYEQHRDSERYQSKLMSG